MLITPLPGVSLDGLHGTFGALHTDLQNVEGGGHGAPDDHTAYMRWAHKAAGALRDKLRSADVDRLVLTRRYWALVSATPPATPQQIAMQALEVKDRLADWAEVLMELSWLRTRWEKLGTLVVPDTSVFIEHPDKLEVLDLGPQLGVADEPVHLLVPMAVIDELDSHKQSKDKHRRWRARHTLSALDRCLDSSPRSIARVREAGDLSVQGGAAPAGALTAEVLFDPPGHVRLPIVDDEIVDRALATQPMTGRQLTLVTFDTGQGLRARQAGLKVVKIPQEPEGEEPEPEAPRQGRLPQRQTRGGSTAASGVSLERNVQSAYP